MFVVTVSSGNSGGGLVHDHLKNRKDFVNPFDGNEFRLIIDPDGLDNLYNNCYENFTINNAAIAFERFEKFLRFSSKIKGRVDGKWNYIYKKNVNNIFSDYLKKITYLDYYGMSQFKYINLSLIDKILFNIKYYFIKQNINKINFFKIRLPCDKKIFLIETKKFIKRLCLNNSQSTSKNILLDQSISYWNPENFIKYFDDVKIIITNRDPRSIYYSMLSRNSRAYPSSDIKIFAKWYKKIREIQSKINNKNIYFIQYENFLKNHEQEVKKLNKFLGINKKIKSTYNIKLSMDRIYTAKKELKKKDQLYIQKKLKRYLSW